MRSRRFAVACVLVAGTVGYGGTTATSGSRVPTLRDVWFTTTVTMPGQRYKQEPERIWTKVEEFVRGKDEKVVFNDHRSHRIQNILSCSLSHCSPSGPAGALNRSPGCRLPRRA
jgi:hypothetical protein